MVLLLVILTVDVKLLKNKKLLCSTERLRFFVLFYVSWSLQEPLGFSVSHRLIWRWISGTCLFGL